MSHRLSLNDIPRLERALSELKVLYGDWVFSECSAANLYLFREAHAYLLVDDPLPGVVGLTYDGQRHKMPLVSPLDVTAQVWRTLQERYALDCVYPLPAKSVLNLLATEVFGEVAAHENDADYIYPADNFRYYRGRLLRKKHNLMQQLLRHTQVTVRPWDESFHADAQQVLAQWMSDKDHTPASADERACLEALANLQTLGLEAWMYYDAQTRQALGFLIVEKICADTIVVRFAKGLDAYKGIYQYMFHHFFSELEPTVQWANFEQDLGLRNFRQTKRSFQPIALSQKYRVFFNK